MAYAEEFWLRTTGAPTRDDPRDGALHRSPSLPGHLDLEPLDENPDFEGDEDDAHYVRSDLPPEIDHEGRTIWLYEFKPTA
ncbi:hypothetical protein [Frondihabitans sp. PAMC 28766]|uniref:hypothetical protein n=1 Tax=Frondihabitans sp. PAMC 28766 TaxID=1795630 RepID=UPI0012FF83A4|nr:hypothetical protein [Frondihabitans sp. PAMC 28766]